MFKKATPLSKSLDMEMSENAIEDDEGTPTKKQLFINLYELKIVSSNCLYAV